MTASGRKIAISDHIEIEWLNGRSAAALCPNCGALGEARQILEIDYRPPVEHEDEHHFILQVCPACAARFVDDMKMMMYNSEQLVERGEDAFHVQLGAGLWPIAGQIARLDRPAGARVLEIGGAYGFGLDFCLRARGWTGTGYDPSPFAGVGMRELALPLRQEYFTSAHLGLGPWDVAIATELLEHISYPAAFLLLMRRALGETGVLMLSTPNAACVTPEQPVSNLLPLLSPGSHTVLQTVRSLELALHAAGFAHTHIIEDGLSLIAYASAAPIRLIEDEAARRAMYRRYLVERAALAALTSDLRLGFAGRGIFEAVNDGDWDAADAAWAALLPAVRARFGLELETMTALPAGAAEASLAELGRLMPLGLGMILFGRAMRRLEAGDGRGALEPVLRLAAEALEVLLRALAKHSLQDALSASMAGLLRTELLICAASAGRAEAVAGLVALADEETGWRGFVELVNAGAIGAAGALKETLPDMPGVGIPAGLRRNALLSLVNFHLAAGGEPLRALPCAEALQAGGEGVDEALLGVFTRLVNAGRYAEARGLAVRHGVNAMLDRQTGEVAADVVAGLATLELAEGDPALVSALLAEHDLPPARAEPLLLQAFIRLINAARYGAARNLADAHDVAGMLNRQDEAAAADAAIGLAVLELAEGDPALVPALLAGRRIPAARRVALVLGAFTGLVNAGRLEEADAFALSEPLLQQLDQLEGGAAEDAFWAALMLDLQRGRAAQAARKAAAREAKAAGDARLAAVYVDAFIRLVNAGDFAAARALEEDGALERRIACCPAAAQLDALASWLVLEAQPEFGTAANVPARLRALDRPDMDEARLTGLGFQAFSLLVNQAAFAPARALLPAVEPALIKLKPPFAALARDALFAAGILYLQDEDDWRRGAAIFARLRDGLVKQTPAGQTPDPLFWPALRGEVVTLHRLNRGAEAVTLLQSFLDAYPGAPEDLREQLKDVKA